MTTSDLLDYLSGPVGWFLSASGSATTLPPMWGSRASPIVGGPLIMR